jgi:signal transduction histidine kinase/ActR/RegA family two-component response regulator
MASSDGRPTYPLSARSEAVLQDEIAKLREQLREATETIEAIRNGDVDAVVVSGDDNLPRIYTLQTADRSYRLLVERMQEGALTLTAEAEILYCNRRFAQLVSEDTIHIIGGSLGRFVAQNDWPSLRSMVTREAKGEFLLQGSPDPVWTQFSFSRLPSDDPQSEAIYCCVVTDLTEQRRTGDTLRETHQALLAQVAERERTEQLLRQSQKLEAVGQLTGGVAHDFNNLLMVISGGINMLERDLPPERRRRLIEGMRQAADRGAALTRQLLAFARRKDLNSETIDLRAHLDGLRELFDRSLRGDVNVKTVLDEDVWPVYVDAGELEIALLNLCVNSRDAMPQSGVITITARNRMNLTLGELHGDFVQLSVADTGQGMNEETLARCLEPFYTTKDIGKGSGLGLAQVYGFAHASKGTLSIESQVGRGTTVSLFLPRSELTSHHELAVERHPESTIVERVLARVLLVEDDLSVAEMTMDMLQEIGYQFAHVPSAQEGLKLLEANAAPIDLVLSDVMMPGGMDGLTFAHEVRRLYPQLPIVLVSGFVEAVRTVAARQRIPLLAKPYSLENLASVLRVAQLRQKLET